VRLGGVEKCRLSIVVAGETVPGARCVFGCDGPVHWLVPIEKIRQRVAEFLKIGERRVMVTRSGDERRGTQQRRSHVRGRVLGVVHRVELLAIFGDAAGAVYNVAGNKDEVGFLK